MMFKKTRQLVQIRSDNEMIFIDVPGYTYYYERFDQHLFIHHKVGFDKKKGHYYMAPFSWVVTEPRTGLSIMNRSNCKTRKQAVRQVDERLSVHRVRIEKYHEAVLLGLAKAPERIPQLKFVHHKSPAIRVRDDRLRTGESK